MYCGKQGECRLKSHSECANHWSLYPHKITEAYHTLRKSVLAVRPSQTSCQKQPYSADVNGIRTHVPRAIGGELSSNAANICHIVSRQLE